MAKRSPQALIRLRGVRHNNLKGFDLDLPLQRLLVITGPSGSGKSSLAFDTLFAEGQRRYVETFSPYARQFLDRMDKPRVDRIEGIPPAIAIEQRNTVRSTRSTVGTMTELCDHLKLVWPHLATLTCRQCGRPVVKDTVDRIGSALPSEAQVVVTFDLPLAKQLSLSDSLALVTRQGYQWLWIDGAAKRIEEIGRNLKAPPGGLLTVVQDRIRLASGRRARFAEACEQAYHFGKGRLTIHWSEQGRLVSHRFSQERHCAQCDLTYREPTSALFSFNHPLGACPTCHGFGRIIGIDYQRALPDWSKSLAGGVVKPWRTGTGAESQRDLMRFCRATGIPTKVPFRDLDPESQRWVIEGDPHYGEDEEHEWPRAWYGVKGYFRWLESKAYKMHVRVLLSRYRAYRTCPDCQGRRFQPEALGYRVAVPKAVQGEPLGDDGVGGPWLTLADFYRLTIRQARRVIGFWREQNQRGLSQALALVMTEIESRLGYLDEVGLAYLTLDRPTRSLSGGETERVNLTTCLGTRLVNTLYVLDEPSVGLHTRDSLRLVGILERLRDLGNTVVVVEHEPAIMRAADRIVDLGPGRGERGGEVVFEGTVRRLLPSRRSLTGAYLSERRSAVVRRNRSMVADTLAWLSLLRVSRHNLKELSVQLPLERLVCVSGVSGSGKSTLIREVLYERLQQRLGVAEGEGQSTDSETTDHEEADGNVGGKAGELVGGESLQRVVLVDQSPVGRTPRSNPAVYVGAFNAIRELYAAQEESRRRGLGPSAFSFNSKDGQCARCRGAGYEKIEMQFLSDVFIRCPECDGRRYRPHVLEVGLRAPDASEPNGGSRKPGKPRAAKRPKSLSIADLLESTVEEAIEFLRRFPNRPAAKAVAALAWLKEVGLGYLRLGQPMNTLSGGESQRLKLVGALADASTPSKAAFQPTLFLLDEPTTGLHFDDVRILLEVLQKLVDAGHSVFVIEHNLDVIRSADWVIDLGPEAGEEGGRVVVEGNPETVAGCPASHTGRALTSS